MNCLVGSCSIFDHGFFGYRFVPPAHSILVVAEASLGRACGQWAALVRFLIGWAPKRSPPLDTTAVVRDNIFSLVWLTLLSFV